MAHDHLERLVVNLWERRAWLAEHTPTMFPAWQGGRAGAWLHDLESTVRWWLRWGVWSPPTRRTAHVSVVREHQAQRAREQVQR